MARTLNQIESQIEKLKQEAEKIKSKERGGVIARIQEAIVHYGITRQELFGAQATKAAKAAKAEKSGKPAGKRVAKATRTPSPAKYADDQGNTWAGRGKRPRWFTEALAAGKTAEELLIKR